MSKAAKADIIARPPTSLVELSPELEDQLAADALANSGFEEATKDSYAVPFLRILQDLSPQVKSKMSGYIEGARPGMIYNTVSQELMEGNIRVIPCHYSQKFIEWKPRKADGGAGGGGFVAVYDIMTGAKKLADCTRDGAKNILPNGNELMDTREHYVLLVKDDHTTERCLIALQSTGLKFSKKWMTQMRAAMIELKGRLVPAPMSAFVYTIGRTEEANEQGQWYQWSIIGRDRVTAPELYNAARSFAESMKTDPGKVNYADTDTATPSDLDDNNNDM